MNDQDVVSNYPFTEACSLVPSIQSVYKLFLFYLLKNWITGLINSVISEPSSPPVDVSAEVTGTNSILLRWSPPPPDTINGQLTGYKIRYKAKDRYELHPDAFRYFDHGVSSL